MQDHEKEQPSPQILLIGSEPLSKRFPAPAYWQGCL